jgi:virulence factor Mce-like protein
MKRTRGTASIVGSPVLVGALTVLITVVAVFLAYNANNGLPFVPTYELKAQLPNAANLVAGNDVRIGGHRVGAVTEILPVHERDGRTYAQIQMRLDKAVQPLPIDTRVLVRARSALGLKYVELTPGSSSVGFQPGDTIALSAARPRPVEIDEVFNIFDAKTRVGIRRSLEGFGNGLTGRGQDLNQTIHELPPFGALARVARPFIQDTISLSPPALDAAIAGFPIQRPFFENTTAFMRELRPGVRVLPATLPALADALQIGKVTLRRSPPFNHQLGNVFRALENFSTDPLVKVGVKRLGDTVKSLRPTLNFLAPVQTTCNYATLWFRNISGLLSEGDKNGTWQRFIIVATPNGPNSESGPSSKPASGPGQDNFLHSNTYPNTASPGQTHECEAGNEDYLVGKKVLGNYPGSQGTKTDGQVKP